MDTYHPHPSELGMIRIFPQWATCSLRAKSPTRNLMEKKTQKYKPSLNKKCHNKRLMINISPNCYAEFIIENYTDEPSVLAGVE